MMGRTYIFDRRVLQGGKVTSASWSGTRPTRHGYKREIALTRMSYIGELMFRRAASYRRGPRQPGQEGSRPLASIAPEGDMSSPRCCVVVRRTFVYEMNRNRRGASPAIKPSASISLHSCGELLRDWLLSIGRKGLCHSRRKNEIERGGGSAARQSIDAVCALRQCIRV